MTFGGEILPIPNPVTGSDPWIVVQFECGTRILRLIHGRDARATLSNGATTDPW